ncbi:MAG: DUF2953 domain-containing protein [Clostridia bacterium]|nr:DUF2953 domain-containing protein [Clostridia bacterium]
MSPWWWLLIVPGTVVGLALLLLSAALFTKTALLIRYDERGVTLRLRVFSLWFTLYPRKEKPKKKPKKQKSKKVSSTREKPAKKSGLKGEVTQALKEASFRDYLDILTTITSKFIAKFRCEKLKIDLAIGGEDADKIALTYGSVNAAVYPIVGALSAVDKLDRCEIRITPDFTSEEFRGEGEGVFSVRLFHSLGCILALTKKL